MTLFGNLLKQDCLDELINEIISKNGDVEIKALGPKSKNHCYIICIQQEPTFVLKWTKYARKEVQALQFCRSNGLYETLTPLDFGENFFVTEYIKNIKEFSSPFAYIEDLARRHAIQLISGLDYNALLQDKTFVNTNARKTISRVERHTKIVNNFYSDVGRLIRFLEKEECTSQPEFKVLVHGDAHSKNIVYSNDKVIYLDFELSCIERPTWDLARIIFGLDCGDVDPLLDCYTVNLKKHCGNKIKLEHEESKAMAYADFIVKFTNAGIGVQQHEDYKDKVERHLTPIREHFKRILG